MRAQQSSPSASCATTLATALASVAGPQCSADALQRVGAALLERGRLSMPQLRRLVPSLDVKTISRCLVVLIQHNCCRHGDVTVSSKATGVDSTAEVPEDGKLYYELIIDEILARLRFGKIIATVAQMSGGAHTADNPAMQVVLVQHVLEHGKVSVGALLDLQSTRLGRPADAEERTRWGSMVQELVERHKLLAIALPKDAVIELDFEQDLQDQHFKEKTSGIAPKALKAWKADRAEKRQARDFDFEDPDEDEYIHRHKVHLIVLAAAHGAALSHGPQRRHVGPSALMSAQLSAQAESGCELARNLDLRVSYERFYIRWRNDVCARCVKMC